MFPSSSSRYHTLILTQTNFGWDNLLYGFFSKEWINLHHQYCRSLPTKPSQSANHPFLFPLNTIITEVHSLWKFRCSQRHSCNLAQHDSKLRHQAHQQLTELFQFHPRVLPSDPSIFKANLHVHLKDDLSSISAWLHNHSHYIQNSVQKATSLNLSHMQSLTTYFSYT